MTGAMNGPAHAVNGHTPHAGAPPGHDKRVPTPRPVFVIGSLRSGASLLAISLGQHPNIRPVPDATWIERCATGLMETFQEDRARGDLSQLASLGIDSDRFLAQFGVAIDHLMLGDPVEGGPAQAGRAADHDTPGWQAFGRLDGLRRQGPGISQPRRWVDGAYTHSFIVGTLVRLFPEARFVHVVRNATEVVAALTDQASAATYKSRHIPFSAPDAYEHWIDCVTACVEAERTLGSRMLLRVRHRDLLTSPEATVRLCLQFLDEPVDQRCLRPFQGVRQPTATQGACAPRDQVPPETIQHAETLSFALLGDQASFMPRPGTNNETR